MYRKFNRKNLQTFKIFFNTLRKYENKAIRKHENKTIHKHENNTIPNMKMKQFKNMKIMQFTKTRSSYVPKLLIAVFNMNSWSDQMSRTFF